MVEAEQKIIENVKKAIPNLSENEKARLLGFTEGMAFKAEEQQKQKSSCEE